MDTHSVKEMLGHLTVGEVFVSLIERNLAWTTNELSLNHRGLKLLKIE